MGSSLDDQYLMIIEQLKSCSTNVSDNVIKYLKSCHSLIQESDKQKRFSEPMPWIGIYIALASLFCIFPMVADLIHGLKTKKLWFPCKHFTINAFSFTVIPVAMKLPMDLNNSMPGYVDQLAKLGSMGFMCAMLSNLLPALATMNDMELVANIIGLGFLVISLVVNVCIQIKTGVIQPYFKEISIIYGAMLFMLLIIHGCSSLAIIKSKQILELKYQAAHEIALKDQELQQQGTLTAEKLKQHLKKYWIMAATSNPQFLIACSVTSCASGVISAFSTLISIFITLFKVDYLMDFDSDYKWSVLVILIIQFIGSLLGIIAPLSRCFAALSFKLSIKWIWNSMKVFNVESYWTQTLSDLKWSSIPFVSSSRKFKILFQNMKVLILSVCMGFQMMAVVACKMIGIIQIFIVVCIFSCSLCCKFLKLMLVKAFDIVLAKNPKQHETNENFCQYVFQLKDDMELAEGTLKRVSNSFDGLFMKAEKQQPYNLMKLLEESSGSGGVEIFYNIHHVPHLVLDEPLVCWSLSLVTLTSIAITLTNIQNNLLDRLMRGVNEGIIYVTHVEESLNATNDHATIQKAAKTLWVEVEVYHNWLGNKLRKLAPQVHTAGQILLWLKDTAKRMVTEVEITDDNSRYRYICSNSMYCLTDKLLLHYHADIDQVSQEELFAKLSSLIADILAACLTNLPQVIEMKWHSSAIQKREASVYDATQPLGETTPIINTLEDHELRSSNVVD